MLINCETGAEGNVIENLEQIDGVKEAHGTYGAYDIIVKVGEPTIEQLRYTITWKIRRTQYIRSTLTLMEVEDQQH